MRRDMGAENRAFCVTRPCCQLLLWPCLVPAGGLARIKVETLTSWAARPRKVDQGKGYLRRQGDELMNIYKKSEWERDVKGKRTVNALQRIKTKVIKDKASTKLHSEKTGV